MTFRHSLNHVSRIYKTDFWAINFWSTVFSYSGYNGRLLWWIVRLFLFVGHSAPVYPTPFQRFSKIDHFLQAKALWSPSSYYGPWVESHSLLVVYMACSEPYSASKVFVWHITIDVISRRQLTGTNQYVDCIQTMAECWRWSTKVIAFRDQN